MRLGRLAARFQQRHIHALARASHALNNAPGLSSVGMRPPSAPTADVAEEELGAVRAAVLSRPAALNAVNLAMVQRLTALFARWEAQPHVAAVLLKGEGKAFCSGGDVRALAQLPPGPARLAQAVAYFREEDALVYRLATYPKPFVALLDGIVMGGGAGLSLHGRFRVATERAVFAMPEAAIGFMPDVGATHFLNRLPGRLGVACSLAGLRLRGRELRDVGLATHFVESATLPLLAERLVELGAGAAREEALGNALRELESPELLAPPPPGSIATRLPDIDAWFAADSAEGILAALDAAAGGAPFAAELAAGMRRGAPEALKVSLAALARNRNRSLRECLLDEFRCVVRFMEKPDFYEGVAAQLLRKDGQPAWARPTLGEVTPEAVAAYSAPLDGPGQAELELPPEPGMPPVGLVGKVEKARKSPPRARKPREKL